MINLSRVSKTYYSRKGKTTVPAVREVDLQISRGEFVVITGRSGSGKTTLLNLVSGLAQPTAGQVQVDGVDIWSLKDDQRSALRNRKMGFVFQFPSLLQSLTVLENVVLPTMFFQGAAKPADYDRAEHLLQLVGLTDKISSYPRQLSAGQQQRVVVARALINQPELLLADEPTSNLDEQTEKEIMELFQNIHSSNGITILLVTHVGQLITHGTRRINLADGIIQLDTQLINP